MDHPLHQELKSKNKAYTLVSFCLIVAFAYRFLHPIKSYLFLYDLNIFAYTDFLINFQGGFVRRGLLGEALLWLYLFAPFPMKPTLFILCYIAFAAVLAFFLYQFHKKKYSWWIVLSPIFLGFCHYIVRKDFILYLILIGCLYLLQPGSKQYFRQVLSCILLILGLFIHEAFIFFGFPIYAIITIRSCRNAIAKIAFTMIPLAVFAVLCRYKGTIDTAHAIVDSWNALLPGSPLTYETQNSIGAIGWDTISTFKRHLSLNANISQDGYGIALLPLYVLAVYYMIINFFTVFRKGNIERTESDALTLSLVYSLTIIGLIPMFTVLSCDNGRVFQYASVATFSAFLIIPHDIIISAFPKWYVNKIRQFNSCLNRFLPPSKGLIILMLLLIGMSPCFFSLNSCWSYSIIGTLSDRFTKILCHLVV